MFDAFKYILIVILLINCFLTLIRPDVLIRMSHKKGYKMQESKLKEKESKYRKIGVFFLFLLIFSFLQYFT